MTCPICYNTWAVERTFKMAVILEAYARVTGQRPAHVTASRPPEEMKQWTQDDYKIKLRRRGTRQLKQNGAVAGFGVLHPYRISNSVKPALRDAGYGQLDGEYQGKGFWKGVHVDVLDLDDWRKYVAFGPHFHHIVFPSFLEPNTTRDYLLKKIRVLENTSHIVGLLVYLLSHVGKVEGTKDQPTFLWGQFRGRDAWKPEDHLSPADLTALRHEIAGLLHRVWNEATESLDFQDADDPEEWSDIRDLAPALDQYRHENGSWDPEAGMTREEFQFWLGLVHDQGDADYGYGPVPEPLPMLQVESDRPECVTPAWSRPLTEDEMEAVDMAREPDVEPVEGPRGPHTITTSRPFYEDMKVIRRVSK